MFGALEMEIEYGVRSGVESRVLKAYGMWRRCVAQGRVSDFDGSGTFVQELRTRLDGDGRT
jgi:hypothetical protein